MKIWLLLAIILCSGCSFLPQKPVPVINESKLQYSGKGAGAGVMLMSSMGPVGIAIGMAIDAGLAKEISDTASKKSIIIERLIEAQLSTSQKPEFLDKLSRITIERYGFVGVKGDSDFVYPQLHLSVAYNNLSKSVIQYPEDFIKSGSSGLSQYFLERIKQEPELIETSWNEAIGFVFNQMD